MKNIKYLIENKIKRKKFKIYQEKILSTQYQKILK